MNALNAEIRRALEAQAEEDYRVFASGLIPGEEHLLGVRLPALQKLAGRLARGDWKGYLREASDASFEEVMLQGLTLAKAEAPLAEKRPFIVRFLPKISNWSVCDSFCAAFKDARQEPEAALALIDAYLASDRAFEARFAVVLLLHFFVDEARLDGTLERLTRVRAQGEPARMGVAWALSICYKKDREKTLAALCRFPKEIQKKALQKMMELSAVRDEEKKKLKELKNSL